MADRKLRQAFHELRERGSATRAVVSQMQVGLGEYLDSFKQEYLGAEGEARGFKLILGANGEGKTHLLFCVEEAALALGHLCVFLEAAHSGVMDTSLSFARQVLLNLKGPWVLQEDSDEEPLLRLFRGAIARKREEVLAHQGDPEVVLPEWARGLRAQALPPHGFAQALSDGILATLGEDIDGALQAAARMRFEDARFTRDRQDVEGKNLLRSLAKMPRLLGFQPLVLLIDEAEVALARANAKKVEAFLKFLRFLNDHMAQDAQALVLLGCTDDFWPGRFVSYTALYGRLSDAGYDRPEDRGSLSSRQLARMNKLWVRETFRGGEDDFIELGRRLLEIGRECLPELDEALQQTNLRRLARVASSPKMDRYVKRTFIKALAQLVDGQCASQRQQVITEAEAEKLFGLAAKAIAEADAEAAS